MSKWNLPPYDGDEPTALAGPRAVFRDDVQPGKAYLINTEHMLTIPGDEIDWDRDAPEDTFLLALESIQRWGNRYRVSPAMRLRAIRAVVDAALADQSV